jgi:hypothetical protein
MANVKTENRPAESPDPFDPASLRLDQAYADTV